MQHCFCRITANGSCHFTKAPYRTQNGQQKAPFGTGHMGHLLSIYNISIALQILDLKEFEPFFLKLL